MCNLVLVLDKIMAEREANDRLRAEDPVAHEAKMRIFQVLRSFPSKCCPCGAREPREPARSARSEAQAKKWLVVRALLTRATRVSCVAWRLYLLSRVERALVVQLQWTVTAGQCAGVILFFACLRT